MMRYILLPLLLSAILLTGASAQDTHLKLWYDHPARQWLEALPLGNGRLGAMVYGDPCSDTIQFNEMTVWAGQPNRNDNPDAKAALPEVRRLIFAGKFKEAQDLVNAKFISRISHGMPYQTVGQLMLSFPHHEGFTEYYRELDIERAVTTTRYAVNGVGYECTAFASFPDQVIIVRVRADTPGSVTFSATMGSPASVTVTPNGNDELVMSGITGNCDSVRGKVRYQAHIKIVAEQGSVHAVGNSLGVINADGATIYISIGSSFKNYADISGDAGAVAGGYLRAAATRTFEQALRDNIAAYQKYFNRVRLDLGVTDAAGKPTDVRIARFAEGGDPQLAALYFQYGRYLLIACSQPGGQPATLQGLWNNQLYPPWDSKYTVNINTEMNYWPSEVTNLSEMNEPLVQMIREVANTGRETAKSMYGANGWVLHHNTDLWRINGPIDGSYWGMWPMAGAWLSQHLWEKYAYSGDKEYLTTVYPIMKGAAEFFLSFLVEYPGHDWLVVCPSVSPENSPSVHHESSISAGTTMDNQLLFDLFTRTTEAAKILGIDGEFAAQVEGTLQRLPPMQIGKHSQLQEWIEDWDTPEDHHRHVSHLYGVYPSNQISPFRTPELFDAARTSLIHRGDPSTGWSMNWKINLWARFLDGNHAYKLMTRQISLVDKPEFEKGGTYGNMFDAHPPFQIDGNFGFTAGVAEMLMQSHDGAIFVLPALPDACNEGGVTGLRARGGFEIAEMKWKKGRLTSLTIISRLGGNCRIRSYVPLNAHGAAHLSIATGENSNAFFRTPSEKKPLISPQAKLHPVGLQPTFLYDFATKAGETYTFVSE
jgi:alpha-L-fucosidase 2